LFPFCGEVGDSSTEVFNIEILQPLAKISFVNQSFSLASAMIRQWKILERNYRVYYLTVMWCCCEVCHAYRPTLTLLFADYFHDNLGDLGAGKTTLCRGIIRNLCGDESMPVTSPTYLLDNTYQLNDNVEIHHLDLYRLPTNINFSFLSIPKIFSNNLCLIEWPERLGTSKPSDYIDIDLKIHSPDDSRSATLTFYGNKYSTRINEFEHHLMGFK
jgi:tRNA threonylcarbamoyladenosine biosynthesis protein TsaE